MSSNLNIFRELCLLKSTTVRTNEQKYIKYEIPYIKNVKVSTVLDKITKFHVSLDT